METKKKKRKRPLCTHAAQPNTPSPVSPTPTRNPSSPSLSAASSPSASPPEPGPADPRLLHRSREHTGADQGVGGQVHERAAGGAVDADIQDRPMKEREMPSYIRSASASSTRGRPPGRPSSPAARDFVNSPCIGSNYWRRQGYKRTDAKA